MCLGTPEKSVCMVVQLANRRKVRVEVQRNPDGDNPSVFVTALADLRICGRHVIYRLYWPPAQFIKMKYGFYDNIINLTL